MVKFSSIFILFIMTGSVYAQSRMANQAPAAQAAKVSSPATVSSDYHVSPSSYSGSTRQGNGYSERETNNSSSYHASVNTSNTPYYSGGGHDHYGRVLYASNTNALSGRREFLPSQRLELPRQEITIMVFDTQPLEVGEKASGNAFRHSGLGFFASTYPSTQTNNPPLSNGSPQQPNFNPFFQSSPNLQNSDYNKSQFSFQCPLTGLNTGYLSNHRCNGCIGYYHYWRTYTNFGCFEYLNGQINKVASIDELKALIQSYYDCIDYYQQYNFLDPNTRGRFRYGVGH
jgi:hypothetical protein